MKPLNRRPELLVLTTMKQQTISELLSSSAREFPQEIALVYGAEKISFSMLRSEVRRVANGLSKNGIESGDRVAFWLPNCPAYVICYLACAQLNAIAVAVNTRFKSTEVGDIISRSGAKCLIYWSTFRNIDFKKTLENIEENALSKIETLITYSEEQDTLVTPSSLRHATNTQYQSLTEESELTVDLGQNESGCNIFTTSGTTKAPKFVLHNHRSIIDHALSVWKNLSDTIADGAFFHTLPFCGVFGFNHLTAALVGGKTSILQSAFDAGDAVAKIDKHKVRYISATDDMILALLQADSRNEALPTLTCCGYGAFNLPAEEITARAKERKVSLVGLYGMSEVQALFARRPQDSPTETRYLPGGILVDPQAEVRVCDPDSGEFLPHRQNGELQFRGPSLMKEYFENSSATNEAITEDGFLRSGDLGYTISDNEFVFETRMGDSLRLGGYLVSPAEIENVIMEHSSVLAAQVVAIRVADKMLAYAFVIPDTDQKIFSADLQEHCQQKLARFKVPVEFHTLDEFPTTKSANGTKIQRAKLRQMALENINSLNSN